MGSPSLLAAVALLFQDDRTAPVGPAGWTAKNWIGFVLYIVVFLAVVAFIFYIGRDEEDEVETEGHSPPGPSQTRS
ncbi:MAG: hypothetical protein JXQ29_05860 [Planctomycetes bacterium]|nr:hypothetical protein [Planctomycetota bacterium]